MSMTVWLTFVAACFLFSLSPGAGAISTMSAALSQGIRRALFNILGLQLALAVHITLVAAGLGVLLSSSVWAFMTLKLAGAAYLVWLGISKWREKPQALVASSAAISNPWKLVRTGALVNLTNPKSIVFLAAFLPQFLDHAAPLGTQYLILGTTVLAMDWLVMIGYSLLAASARKTLGSPAAMRTGNRIFGSLFIGAGLALASAKAS